VQKKSTIRLFIILVFLLPLAAWMLTSWYESRIQTLPVLQEPEHRIADFHLLNQDSQQRTLKSWNEKIVVADFFFTHCPAICPKMTKNLLQVLDKYRDDSTIYLSSFSVDPGRDDPRTLKAFADRFGIASDKWDLLTGDKKEIYKLARNSFRVVATDGDGGPDDFIHSEQLVLIDKQKRIRGYYKGTSEKEVEQLIIDIKKLKHEN
jgi:protein SCO1/2